MTIVLAQTDIHLWRIALERPFNEAMAFAESLSAEESHRAEAFHFEQDRRRFKIAHGALRSILSRYIGCDPAALIYHTGAHGKPFLVNEPDLYFNLSHSHERAVAAISRLHPLGVDIEYIRPLENLDALARQCFSVGEYREFTALPEADRLPGFFNAWTRKEAFIKAIGDGLSYPLAGFDISLRPGESAVLLRVAHDPREAARWTLQALDAGPAYTAALAVRAVVVTVQMMDFSE
jgi:4'-phosphopantetheinyl transferase